MSVAFDEFVTVTVCLRCGRGFPPWAPLSTGVDTLPIWWTQTERGPACNGQILAVLRRDQIERIENEEFFRGEQWTTEEATKMKQRTEPPCPVKLNRL